MKKIMIKNIYKSEDKKERDKAILEIIKNIIKNHNE